MIIFKNWYSVVSLGFYKYHFFTNKNSRANKLSMEKKMPTYVCKPSKQYVFTWKKNVITKGQTKSK